jgi:hypothetical protein
MLCLGPNYRFPYLMFMKVFSSDLFDSIAEIFYPVLTYL